MAAEEKGQERGRQTGWLGFDDPDWPGQGHAMSPGDRSRCRPPSPSWPTACVRCSMRGNPRYWA
jgi:hypothetical protein